jgi:hypothetical protein
VSTVGLRIDAAAHACTAHVQNPGKSSVIARSRLLLTAMFGSDSGRMTGKPEGERWRYAAIRCNIAARHVLTKTARSDQNVDESFEVTSVK